MKKLALVTLLAVAASWLLSEPRPTSPEKATIVNAFDRLDFQAGEPAGSRVLVFQDEAPRPPAPPEHPGFPEGVHAFQAPEPPSPPEEIRTVPWRKSDHPRSSRTAPGRPSAGMPSWFPKSEDEEQARTRPDSSGTRVLIGRLSASEDRARKDLRKILEREVANWVAADLPTSWKAPAPLIDAMVRGSYVQKVTRDLKPSAVEAAPGPAEVVPDPTEEVPGLDDVYTLYRAGQRADFSPDRKARIIEDYRRDIATRRMQRLGGGLALALGLLAVMTGYIRADEATRGYYTNRLRLAAIAGLGAAGVAAYRFLS